MLNLIFDFSTNSEDTTIFSNRNLHESAIKLQKELLSMSEKLTAYESIPAKTMQDTQVQTDPLFLQDDNDKLVAANDKLTLSQLEVILDLRVIGPTKWRSYVMRLVCQSVCHNFNSKTAL